MSHSKVINLTPHAVTVRHGDRVQTYQPTKDPARVSSSAEVIGEVDGFPVLETIFGEVENLPNMSRDTVLIVSRIVFDAANQRDDLVCPGKAIRDRDGNVIACEGFSR